MTARRVPRTVHVGTFETQIGQCRVDVAYRLRVYSLHITCYGYAVAMLPLMVMRDHRFDPAVLKTLAARTDHALPILQQTYASMFTVLDIQRMPLTRGSGGRPPYESAVKSIT